MSKTKAFVKPPGSNVYQQGCTSPSLITWGSESGWVFFFFLLFSLSVWVGHVWKANYTEDCLLKGHFFYFWTMTVEINFYKKFCGLRKSRDSLVKSCPGDTNNSPCPQPCSACWSGRVNRTLITLAWSGLTNTLFRGTNQASPMRASDVGKKRDNAREGWEKHIATSRKLKCPVSGWLTLSLCTEETMLFKYSLKPHSSSLTPSPAYLESS